MNKNEEKVFTIVRDDDRYNHGRVDNDARGRWAGGQYPKVFEVVGLSLEQAQRLASHIHYEMDPGCDNLFYVLGHEE